jgi:hypothetical protein
MTLAIATTFAMLVTVFMWALGISGFDSMLVGLAIVLIVGGIRTLGRFIPTTRRAPGRSPQGGW